MLLPTHDARNVVLGAFILVYVLLVAAAYHALLHYIYRYVANYNSLANGNSTHLLLLCLIRLSFSLP
jgi:hypothetical protein